MKYFLALFLLFFFLSPFAQDYSSETTSLANFLKRMYNQTAFEGIKIVEDYDNSYFISVLSLERSKYKKESDMFRVAQVKALRQASEFVNGANTTSDLIIRTTETKDGENTEVTVETIDKIHSFGFVQGMELLNNFIPSDTTKMVFIYSRKIE
ncbi:MAG: hypothetical protein ACK5L7_01435 [Paludibacteraceae bacterium]